MNQLVSFKIGVLRPFNVFVMRPFIREDEVFGTIVGQDSSCLYTAILALTDTGSK